MSGIITSETTRLAAASAGEAIIDHEDRGQIRRCEDRPEDRAT
jgi:hypothetical protein